MIVAGNLFAQQQANRKASRRLVAGFVLFLAWLGFGGDLIWYLWSRDQGRSVHVIPGVGLLLCAIATIVAWIAYRFGATMLIKATGGREVTDPRGPDEQRLRRRIAVTQPQSRWRRRRWRGRAGGCPSRRLDNQLVDRAARDTLHGDEGRTLARIPGRRNERTIHEKSRGAGGRAGEDRRIDCATEGNPKKLEPAVHS